MSAKTKMIPMESVIVNTKYQVRKDINDWWVGRLREVLKSGASFYDPIVIDQHNNLLAGFHRMEAYRAELEPTAKIQARVESCKDDREAYLLAVRENTRHGEPLNTYDQKLIRCKLRDLYAVADERIAELLGVTEDRFKRWDLDVVNVRHKKGAVETVPIKRGWSKLRGRTITEKQHEIMHNHGHGTSTLFHVRKVMDRLRSDTVEDTEDVLVAMEQLGAAISTYLEKKGAAV